MKEPAGEAAPSRERWFEELAVGDRFEGPAREVSEAEILAFARAYDPQPLHADPAWAREGPYGAVIASGFHGLALAFRLFLDLGVITRSGVLGLGLEEVRWLKPLKAGMRIFGRCEIAATRPSRSRPDCGVVSFRLSLIDEEGEEVLHLTDIALVRRRPA